MNLPRFAPIVLITAIAALVVAVPACTDEAPPARLLTVPEAGTFDSSTPKTETFTSVVDLPGELKGGTLDFGELECGAAAPAARVFQVRNTGRATLTWAASLSASTAFSLVGETSGSIEPGATGSLTVAVAGVAPSEAAGAVAQATLTLTSNAPGGEKAEVKLTRKAAGGTLELAPATVAFGEVQATTTSAPTALTLSNKGNRPLTVELGASSDTHFTVTTTGTAPFAVAPGEALSGVNATFAPSIAGAVEGNVPLTVTGPVCGVSATQIPLSGTGVVGVARTTPGALAFGSVNCGATAAAKTVTVFNDGTAPLTFQAALLADGATRYAVSPATGSVAGGQSATVTVTPKPVPGVASTADNAFGASLRITTNALGDGNHDVTLSQTARGAILAMTPSAIAFGDVPLGSNKTAPVTLTNSGNASITVTPGATGAGFGVTSNAAVIVPGPGGGGFTARFQPSQVGNASGRATVTIATAPSETALCAPLPSPVTLAARATNGELAISAAALDFGMPNCGSTASAQTFEVQNKGTASFDFSIAQQKGASSPYIVSPTSGSLPAGGKVLVTVTPKAIPSTSALTPNLYGDTLTITPRGIAGGIAQSVTLKQSARGAILAFVGSPVVFGNVVVGAVSNGTLSVRNTGNAPATITAMDDGADAAAFTENNTALLVQAGAGPVALEPRFAPGRTGSHSASIAIATSFNDALCAPLPAAAPLSGTGIKGNLVVDSSSIAFRAVGCGAGAQTAVVKLTNDGTAAFTYGTTLVDNVGFGVSPASGTLQPGASVNLSVTSPAFTNNHGNVNMVASTLRISTNINGSTPTEVGLTATPQGAILRTSAPSVAFGNALVGSVDAAAPPLLVNNIGNLDAPITLSRTDNTAANARFFFATGLTAPANGSVDTSLSFQPNARGARTNTINVSTTARLCAALPRGVSVSGTGIAGVLTVSPNPILTNGTCGGSGGTVGVDLTNTGDAPLTWRGTVNGAGGGFVKTPDNGTLQPKETVTVNVRAPTVAQNATPTSLGGPQVKSSVTFTTDSPSSPASQIVPIQTNVRGALLTWENSDLVTISSYDFGPVYGFDCYQEGPTLYVRYRGDAGVLYGLSSTASTSNPDTIPRIELVPTGKIQMLGDGSTREQVQAYILHNSAAVLGSPSSCQGTRSREGKYNFTFLLPAATQAGICNRQDIPATAEIYYPVL